MLIVTVIEAGPIERQVCLLAESIRISGGALSDSSFLAVIPRRGPALARETKAALRRLDVELVNICREDDLTWFHFLNKTKSLSFAAKRGGKILWLDADILCLGEPIELFAGEQFIASPTDKNIGTTGNDQQASYFKAACNRFGVDFDSIPTLTTERERTSIRAYWNSGVFAFDASSGLAELHDEFTACMVRERIGSFECGLYMSDQVALALAVHKLGLSVKNLSLSHNFNIQPTNCVSELSSSADIRLLHYHACLWRSTFCDMVDMVSLRNRKVGEILGTDGPLCDPSLTTRVGRRLLSFYRSRPYRIANVEAINRAKALRDLQ